MLGAAHRSGRDTLASSGSCHRAKTAAFRREMGLFLLPVGPPPLRLVSAAMEPRVRRSRDIPGCADYRVAGRVVIRPEVAVPTAGSRQLVDQPLRFSQIAGVEALGEPAVNGRQQIASFGPPTLFAPQSGEACRDAQLVGLSLLPPRDAQRLLEGDFRLLEPVETQQSDAFEAMKFCPPNRRAAVSSCASIPSPQRSPRDADPGPPRPRLVG